MKLVYGQGLPSNSCQEWSHLLNFLFSDVAVVFDGSGYSNPGTRLPSYPGVKSPTQNPGLGAENVV